MKPQRHVLVVDDETNVRRVLGVLLEQAGHAVTKAGSAEEALDLVRAQDPDVVLTDLKMGGMDGMALLSRLRADFPEIPVVLLTAHGTIETAVEAMKRGAFDFLTKPFEREHVLEIVGKALSQGEGDRREFQGPLRKGSRCGMVGSGPAMERVFSLIERAAPAPSTVLVTGETGTGKELVASALHELSSRRAGPFVKINCGALPEHLVESELFGHEKGAFSGADRSKPGRFELAHGGTLFLDEIGELAASAQVKLLRVLQDRVIDRLGGTQGVTVDVRLVAATNRDLAAACREGKFREDLRQRLNVVVIPLPPLRERQADVPDLVDLFLEKHAQRMARSTPRLADGVMAALQARPWPGNVRELENAVERAVVLGSALKLELEDFGLDAEAVSSASDLKSRSKAAAGDEERRLVREALEETGQNVTRAAEALGLSRRGLQLKMKALGLR